MAGKKMDYNNMDNMVKVLFPEFVSLSALGPMAQLPTFAEAAFSKTLSQGTAKKDEIPQILLHMLYGRAKHGL